MTISSLYKLLEIEYTTLIDSLSYFGKIQQGKKGLDVDVLNKERFVLLDTFDTIFNDAKIDNVKSIIQYCEYRVQNTKNIHLLSRYYYALFVMTHHNKYVEPIIKYNILLLNYYYSTISRKGHLWEFCDILEQTINIYLKNNKKNLHEIKDYILKLLSDTQDVPQLYIQILQILLKVKVFKSKELVEIPIHCKTLYLQEEDVNKKILLLELAIKFSEKVQDKDIYAYASEQLGDVLLTTISPDDENNIIISHQNENIYHRILKLYKNAKTDSKIRNIQKRIAENKKLHKYITFPITVSEKKINEVYDVINEIVKTQVEGDITTLIARLSYNNEGCLLPLKAQIQTSHVDDFYYSTAMEAINVDRWGNKRKTTHISNAIFQQFEYQYKLISYHYIVLLIYNSIKMGKLDKEKLKDILCEFGFNSTLQYHRADKKYHISVYEILNIGLDEYLKQIELFIDNKNADWRFVIDFLTPKFELLIRILAEELGAIVRTLSDDGAEQFVVLERILNDETLKKSFNEDDILLFKHTFTKDGLNIRNDVAHGLLMPNEYTAEKATLVFISILRLSKALIKRTSD